MFNKLLIKGSIGKKRLITPSTNPDNRMTNNKFNNAFDIIPLLIVGSVDNSSQEALVSIAQILLIRESFNPDWHFYYFLPGAAVPDAVGAVQEIDQLKSAVPEEVAPVPEVAPVWL